MELLGIECTAASPQGGESTMTQARRKMTLTAMMFSGVASQAWRHPDLPSGANFDLGYYTDYARTAEAGLFDAVFMADNSELQILPNDTFQQLSTASLFEPATLMAALATQTEKVGLIFTASTSDTEPAALARLVASVDHISAGRAGWNLVTSYGPGSVNLGLTVDGDHDLRYERAREFHKIVTALWDSFEDDAFVHNKGTGKYFDPAKLHSIDHKGRFFTNKGVMRMARPVQGQPVIVQAGASEAGRDLGAATADIVFCIAPTIEEAQVFYSDMKSRVAKAGRRPEDLNIVPGCGVVWGRTDQEAAEKLNEMGELYPIEMALHNLFIDFTGLDLDGPFPEKPKLVANRAQGHLIAITNFARRNNLSIRQTARCLAAAHKHRIVAGTAKTIADDLEEWMARGAADGFMIISPYQLAGFKEFVAHVVPELQRRGLFRTGYEGSTLREHLGLRRPPNRYVADAGVRAAS